MKAGCPHLLVHDLRCSGARNLRQAGVPETIIMAIGGWRTRSVFIRYAIVDEKEIADAVASLEQRDGKLIEVRRRTPLRRRRRRPSH